MVTIDHQSCSSQYAYVPLAAGIASLDNFLWVYAQEQREKTQSEEVDEDEEEKEEEEGEDASLIESSYNLSDD